MSAAWISPAMLAADEAADRAWIDMGDPDDAPSVVPSTVGRRED